MSEEGEEVSYGEFIDRTIAVLERAEALRRHVQQRVQFEARTGQLDVLAPPPPRYDEVKVELFKLKAQFDYLAGRFVQVAYGLGIEASPLDEFIRTSNPALVPAAIRVLRLIQADILRREIPGFGPAAQSGEATPTAKKGEAPTDAAPEPTPSTHGVSAALALPAKSPKRRGRLKKADSEAKRVHMLATLRQHPSLKDDPAQLAQMVDASVSSVRRWLDAEVRKYLESKAANPEPDED